MAERQPSKLNVEGSSPFARFDLTRVYENSRDGGKRRGYTGATRGRHQSHATALLVVKMIALGQGASKIFDGRCWTHLIARTNA